MNKKQKAQTPKFFLYEHLQGEVVHASPDQVVVLYSKGTKEEFEATYSPNQMLKGLQPQRGEIIHAYIALTREPFKTGLSRKVWKEIKSISKRYCKMGGAIVGNLEI